MRRLVYALFAALVLAGLLVGCGGGSGSHSSSNALGSARVAVTWPERSRMIPDAANSILVTLTKGAQSLGSKVLVRPDGGGQTETTFTNLALGDVVVTASAVPTTNGTGIAQARASATVTIMAGQTTPVNLTMASTVDHLEVTPAAGSVYVGQAIQLQATARDTAGRIVLTNPAKLQWQGTSAAATLSTTGLVTGLATGAIDVTATDTETNKSATARVTVSTPPPPPPVPGKIYVVDMFNDQIVRMDDMSGRNWISYPPATEKTNTFFHPQGVAIDAQSRIYISDSAHNRLVRIDDMAGTNWKTIGDGGSGPGFFSYPTGVAIGPDGRIYVTDYVRSVIVRMDDINGANWTELAGPPGGGDTFHAPFGLTVGPDNRIYIADSAHHRIVRVNDMTGAGWTTFGTNGTDVGQFNTPTGVSLDSAGRIYIADQYNYRLVRIDDMTGANWTTVSIPETSEARWLGGPIGVSVANGDKIYVADHANSKVLQLNGMNVGWTSYGTWDAWGPAGTFHQIMGLTVGPNAPIRQ